MSTKTQEIEHDPPFTAADIADLALLAALPMKDAHKILQERTRRADAEIAAEQATAWRENIRRWAAADAQRET